MKKRIGLILIAALTLSSVFSFADTKSKKIDSWFYNIKVIINGQTLNTPLEPFIYNDNVYVPLRPIVEGMGGTPSWDGTSKTVTIQNKASTEVTSLNNEVTRLNFELSMAKSEIKTKDDKIKYLEDKIKDLEDDDDKKDDELKDLEDDLDDDYNRHTNKTSGRMEFNYSLDKSSSTIEVEMKGDFGRSETVWKNRDKSDFQSFIKDEVVRKIHRDDDFDDYDIEVTVKDEDNKTIGEYEYDESKDTFTVKDEY